MYLFVFKKTNKETNKIIIIALYFVITAIYVDLQDTCKNVFVFGEMAHYNQANQTTQQVILV